MKYLIYITLSVVLLACPNADKKSEQKKIDDANVSTYYIAPYQVDCVGVGPMKCLLVKKDDNAQWQNFYSPIKGFQFEPGSKYTIKVKESKKENVPADASSIAYELVEIIEKTPYTPDNSTLHDIWGIVDVMGTNPLKADCEQTLEINLSDSIIMGKAGCNNFRGVISTTKGSNGLAFKKVLASRRTCPKQNLEDNYLKALNKVDAYFKFNQNLYLIHNDTVIIKCVRMD